MKLPSITKAKDCFDKVADGFGLTCIESSEQLLKYQNEFVSLTVALDRLRSFELSITLGGNGAQYPQESFSLAEILRFRGRQESDFLDGLMVVDEEGLSNILPRVANLILIHAADFLSGNKESYSQIQEWRNMECKKFELDSSLKYAREIIEEAWKARDYETIVNVLSPIKGGLTEFEIKRLEYALKHTGHTNSSS
ncbi:hypothetical protein [Pseudomonas sp. G5(2012)]|uniref:hypothetical protein n=1 Tax=Pseudomonas sp. G5(2012) TaxID=1268068 RepID=UPI0005B36AE9|nr:hypothetical protein [Pseudomonas sp. G5(2012)]